MHIGDGHSNVIPQKASNFHRIFHGSDPKREQKMKAKERLQFMPRLNKLIYGKRYIVPNYRQTDYYNQQLGDIMYSGSVLVPLQHLESRDDVENAQLINAIYAMGCGRPQLWLERELAEAFMRTELPDDMITDDLKWRWPGLRVHLPKRILRITERDLMFLDLCTLPAQTQARIPEPYASEIVAMAREYGWPYPEAARQIATPLYDQDALVISGSLDGPEDIDLTNAKRGDFMTYATVKPIGDGIKIGEIKQVIYKRDGERGHLLSPYENTPDDDRLCERMLHLGLNVLLYLGSMPLEYEPEPEKELRKPKIEGQRQIPGLYAARFVGTSQLRPASHKHAHLADPALPHRHLPAHWKAGHWKRQPFGLKRGQRKLIWIQPYQTTGEGYEEDEK